MRPVPGWRSGAVSGAVLAAACPAAPALLPGARTPWGTVALLAALYAACEQLPRCRPLRDRAPAGMGAFFPVLLAGACLLPPAAAALAAVPGALLAPVAQRPGWPRRGWRTAQLSLACWAAASVYGALDGPAALGGTGGGVPSDARLGAPAPVQGHVLPPVPPDVPWLLVTAAAMALAFCAVLTVLDGGALAAVTGTFPVPPSPWRRASPRIAWGGLFLRSLAPVAVHGLAGLLMAVLWRSPYGWPAALLVLLPMSISYWMFAQYHRERAAHQATVRALVQAVDIKDGYTRGHSERVGLASVMIAQELGMDRQRVEALRLAGLLHDVGKLGVPTRLLRKEGPLTPQERRLMELHPEYGDEMVRGIGALGEARGAILHHHERIDGTGYPYGLRGTQIPECARIVAVADAFDAMTSTRSYRRARPVRAAVDELRRCAGVQFDPRMVRALVSALARHGWRPCAAAPDGPGPRADAPSTAPAAVLAEEPAAPPASGRQPAGAAAGRQPAGGHGRRTGDGA
ncbi:metal-dependent phosphohydrolase [Streptomyces sulfonofaciens]|uniref:Metal-dependent phosphohydrolase n=1 Tax=Streptomyces sulfonofaciens TaxID=68272 RepID=A0A919GBL2_9ACTN|nr:HD-GYP domain-containing protein [Streptomyces sulfonofaciens]GHH81677.1 metal-dependent phosphohydrolase [Streptomyces sulfonofaciens]